jgi:hypothetical protein
MLDPSTDEVAAFEELIGSHGGLGGWQTQASLVYPATWPSPMARCTVPRRCTAN